MGTDKEVYLADTNKNTLTPIAINEGVLNNQILTLLEYNGSVVADTSNKLSIIKASFPDGATSVNNTAGKERVIHLVKKSEGIFKKISSWSADCITKNGQYFLGDHSINLLNNIKADTGYAATTYITGMNIMTQPQYFTNKAELAQHITLWAADTFYVNGQPSAKDGNAGPNGLHWNSVAGPYHMLENLTVTNKQNYLQFQFAQAHLSRQDTTWYSYTLQGIDKKWRAVTTNTFTENY